MNRGKPKIEPLSYAIDDVALASLRSDHGRPKQASAQRCNACGQPFAGPPAATGLLLWTRGDEVRYDEPPLCAQCATTIGVAATHGGDLEGR